MSQTHALERRHFAEADFSEGVQGWPKAENVHPPFGLLDHPFGLDERHQACEHLSFHLQN